MCDEEDRENEIIAEEYRWLVIELFSQVLQQLHHAEETITKLELSIERRKQEDNISTKMIDDLEACDDDD